MKARFDFDEPDPAADEMALADFFGLLAQWRQKIEESAAGATGPLPETYRRNPMR